MERAYLTNSCVRGKRGRGERKKESRGKVRDVQIGGRVADQSQYPQEVPGKEQLRSYTE